MQDRGSLFTVYGAVRSPQKGEKELEKCPTEENTGRVYQEQTGSSRAEGVVLQGGGPVVCVHLKVQNVILE